MTPKPTVQITLAPAQQAQIEQAIGKPITSLKLEALETRVSPALCNN